MFNNNKRTNHIHESNMFVGWILCLALEILFAPFHNKSAKPQPMW